MSNIKFKENHSLIDRIMSKYEKGVQQLEAYLKELVEADQIDRVQSLFNYFIFRSYQPNISTQQKIALIKGLQCCVFMINQRQNLLGFINNIISPILNLLNDNIQKIRFVCIGTLYEIFTFLGDNCLPVFTRVFKQLIKLTIDPSSDVRQAAAHLSHTMKALLNDAILDHQVFNFKDFIDVLTQNFVSPNPLINEFLIDWINAVDQITQFQVSFYLPLFLKQLFYLSDHENDIVRNKTVQCLKGFILGFREAYKIRKDLSSKMTEKDAQSFIQILLEVLTEKLASDINVHALEWLEQFCQFLQDQCKNGKKTFFKKIFSQKFQQILITILQLISHENPKVVQLSIIVNKRLLEIFNYLEDTSPQTVLMLPIILKESKKFLKVEAVIKWIKLLIKENNECIITQINNIVQKIIEKICDQDSQNIKNIIGLLKNSIFTEQFYQLLVEVLLSYIYLHPYMISIDPIFREIISLSNSNFKFLTICRRLTNYDNSVFKYQIADYLINIFVTEDSLADMRNQTLVNPSLFTQLYQIFCCNEPALICLCFMANLYDLVYYLLLQFSERERLEDAKISSFIKMANLLESPNMNRMKLKLNGNTLETLSLRRAYIGLILALPSGKSTKILMKRIQGIQQYDQEDTQLMENFIEEYPSRSRITAFIEIYVYQISIISEIDST